MPADLDAKNILASMQLDKKAIAGELKFVLPEKIGKVRIHKGVTDRAIRESLESS